MMYRAAAIRPFLSVLPGSSRRNDDEDDVDDHHHPNHHLHHHRLSEDDEEFQQYEEELNCRRSSSRSYKRNDDVVIEYVKTRECISDLFDAPEDYCLAHCVAEDMNMDNGIAVQFRHRFKRVGELLNQGQRPGGLSILEDEERRYVYYLVTKEFSSGKPTYSSLFSSLKCLRAHVLENTVRRIAMPRIGCGLDRLKWSYVHLMLEFVFRQIDIDIVVCNLQQQQQPQHQHHHRYQHLQQQQHHHHGNCKVTNEKFSIQDIQSKTVILYFTSEDGCVSEDMEKLDEKFPRFLSEFKHAAMNRRLRLGNVVFYNTKYLAGYVLCGCIVSRKKRSNNKKMIESDRRCCFDFVALEKCLHQIEKENEKYYQFNYYAFQALTENSSSTKENNNNYFSIDINDKIMNILRNSLRDDVEVNVCWPPPSR